MTLTCYHVGVRWVAGIAIALCTAVAVAAPQVDIKAQTQVSLSSFRLAGAGRAEVRGRLTDKLTGEGLSGEIVTIRVGSETVRGYTELDGTFTAQLDVDDGPQVVTLAFPGGGALDPASPTTVTSDPSKAPVALDVRKVDDDPRGVKLIVRASVDGEPIALPIALSISAPGSDKRVELPPATSNQPLVVGRKQVGGPGPKQLRAAFAGDLTHQPASAETTFELSATTQTTMSLASATLPFEDKLAVTGQVIDEDGAPVPLAAVTLSANERELAHGQTGDDGHYAFEVEGAVIAPDKTDLPEPFTLQVASDPGKPFLTSSKSPPATVKVEKPQPVPVSYTMGAFLVTALAAGGFFAARGKPWQRFRRRAPPAEATEAAEPVVARDGGMVIAKPSMMSTLRRAADDGFSGAVRDTVRGRPVGEAVVRLVFGALDGRGLPAVGSAAEGRRGESELEARTAADGSFAFERLEPGEWRAEVAAPGHVTERFAVTIPHRGELRGVRVDLVPVRERVFQLYRRAAEPVLPEPRLWGVWSPRQIVDHVRARRPSPALAELTDFVEEVYFSARLSEETALVLASARVDRAIAERATGRA